MNWGGAPSGTGAGRSGGFGTAGGGGEIRALRDPAEVLERRLAGPPVRREGEPAAQGGRSRREARLAAAAAYLRLRDFSPLQALELRLETARTAPR